MKINQTKLLFASLCAFLGLIACKEEGTTDMAEVEKIPGIILENMDTSVDPKEDFYNYVNGSWVKTNTIPDDEGVWGGFGVLGKSTRADVLEILNTSKELGKYEEGSDQKKALLVFESELDTIARNAAGIEPIKPLLNAINNINSLSDMQTVYATTLGVDAPFYGLAVFPDLNNSTMNTAYISPGGLGLPDRDFYLEQDEKSKDIRNKYIAHVSKMLQFIEYNKEDADAAANTILELETKLAKPTLDKVESRDVRNLNNPTSMAKLSEMTPAVDWKKFLKESSVTKELDTVMVLQPKYMTALQDLLTTTSIDDLKTLMIWSTFNSSTGYLTTEINKANFEFFGKTLYGVKKQRPAEDRALATVNGSVGEAIGKLYVEAKFPPEAKAKAEKMIANVDNKLFKIEFKVLDWMSPETKELKLLKN